MVIQVTDAPTANTIEAPTTSPDGEPGREFSLRLRALGGAAMEHMERATSIPAPRVSEPSSAPWPSDHVLVARVLEGDLDAFGVLLSRHQGRVYSIAANFAANGDDASDLAQEIFLKTYRSLARFRGQAAFSTWLYRIAVNACVDYTRRRRHNGDLPLEDDLLAGAQAGLDPQQEMERKQLRWDLTRAIAGLSAKLRATLVLHDIEGLTHEEIGRIVGCSVGTTKSRLFRAREEMRRQLEQRAEGSKP